MKKLLLAATVAALAATTLPAQAVTSTYTRTIVAPTNFGGTGGVVSLPDVVENPTNPDSWQKLGVVTRNARCAYLKQAEGVLPAGSAQDGTGGKLGYVIALPTAFVSGDTFTLVSHSENPTTYDFDITFYSSLGKCVADQEVDLPAGQGTVTVPLEGPGPKPDGTEDGCVIKTSWHTFFNDSGTVGSSVCPFNANYAIVVMPIGANGKFTLTLTY